MQVQNSATNTIEEQTVNSHKTDAPKKNLETQEVAEVFAADTAENESDSNYLSQLGRNLDQKLSSSLVKLLSFLE